MQSLVDHLVVDSIDGSIWILVSETHDETDVGIIEASGYEYHNYEMICLKKNIVEILVDPSSRTRA